MIEIFPDTDLDVWSLASYLEAEEEGKIERWMAAFASPEGIRHYLYSEIPSGNSASAYRQQGELYASEQGVRFTKANSSQSSPGPEGWAVNSRDAGFALRGHSCYAWGLDFIDASACYMVRQ